MIDRLIIRILNVAVFFTAPTAISAADFPLRMSGIAPAYQVGRHDARDRFCYDGNCLIHGQGTIHINLDPEKNAGGIVATFSGADGDWRIVARKFKLIRTNVYLHGAGGGDVDPRLSPPVLPKVWTYVATWGPGTVYHDGRLAWKGPVHLMVTEEVRDPETGRIDYQGPMQAKDHPGSIHNKYGVQVHIVSHPAEKPVPGYLPPFTRFVHLMYETVFWR